MLTKSLVRSSRKYETGLMLIYWIFFHLLQLKCERKPNMAIVDNSYSPGNLSGLSKAVWVLYVGPTGSRSDRPKIDLNHISGGQKHKSIPLSLLTVGRPVEREGPGIASWPSTAGELCGDGADTRTEAAAQAGGRGAGTVKPASVGPNGGEVQAAGTAGPRPCTVPWGEMKVHG